MPGFEWFDRVEAEIATAFAAFVVSPGGCFVAYPLLDASPPDAVLIGSSDFPTIYCEYVVDTQSAESSFLDASFEPDDGLVVVRAVFRVQPGPGARTRLGRARSALFEAFQETYGDSMGIPLPYTAGTDGEFSVAGLNIPLQL